MIADLKFLHSFNSIPGVGPQTLRAIAAYFPSYADAWTANESALTAAGLNPSALQSIIWKRPSINPDKEMERVMRLGIWIIREHDAIYPAPLKEIPQSPVLIYGMGNPEVLKKNINLAVVGTRKATRYGLDAVEKIVSGVTPHVTVISGLALGIDTRAHETTLESDGITVAVLGSGIDPESIFPRSNGRLAERIIKSGGTVISEYAPGTPALREHFPQRNRIVSGLSRGVLVVEAPERSGALITARLALEQNRDVFALPGSIFSIYSRGPHALIKEGAKIVTCAQDILEEFGIEYTEEKAIRKNGTETPEEKIIFELLHEPMSVDLIKEKTRWETPAIIATLSMLELKGIIKNTGGDTYQRII